MISSRRAETAASPRGGAQGGKACPAPHPSARQGHDLQHVLPAPMVHPGKRYLTDGHPPLRGDVAEHCCAFVCDTRSTTGVHRVVQHAVTGGGVRNDRHAEVRCGRNELVLDSPMGE